MMKKHLKIWLIFTGILAILILNCSLVLAQPDSKSAPLENDSKADTAESEVLLPDTLMADDYILDEKSNVQNTKLGFKYWMNLFAALAIVIVLIYGLSYIFRYLFAKLPAFQGRDDFRVLNSLKLSTHSSLYVVRFVDDIYLLAATAQSVSVVGKVSDSEKVQDILDSMSNVDGVNPHAFSTLLSKRMTKEIETDDLKNKQQILSDNQQHFKDTADRLKSYEQKDEEENS